MSAPSPVVVRRERQVTAPAHRAVEVVQHLASLPVWERKVRNVNVTPTDETQGTYTVRGRLFGIVPWRGSFDYELHPTGFHSTSQAPIRGIVHVEGGFRVVDHGATCVIVHYEHYRFHRWIRWVARFWGRYVSRTMRDELDRIAMLAHPNPTIAPQLGNAGDAARP